MHTDSFVNTVIVIPYVCMQSFEGIVIFYLKQLFDHFVNKVLLSGPLVCWSVKAYTEEKAWFL